MSKERIILDVARLLEQGKVLGVDPAQTTGYAVVDARREKVCFYGEVKLAEEFSIAMLRAAMKEADLMIIEDQYLAQGRDKKGKSKQNPDTVIKLAAIRGAIEMLWAQEKGLRLGENIVRVKPSEWQSCLNLPTQANRERRKAASIRQAGYLTELTDLRENESDAICMALAMLRKMKAIEMHKQQRVGVR